MQRNRASRRTFLKGAAGAALAATVTRRPARADATKKKYVVGVIGTGGRGQFLIEFMLGERKDVDIAYVCDVDSKRVDKAAELVEKLHGRKPEPVADYRRILDDKSVQAVFNCTPDHWHALPTIHGCQAGKDVYTEKPASHNIWEGRKMVEAARKYNRVVQLGTQTRSGGYAKAAVEYLRAGKLGEVHYIRVLNQKICPNIGHKADTQTPDGVDYDRWLGAAPSRPFNPNRFHSTWHWRWDYSGGDIINDGVHQIDLARWLSGKDYATSVVASGGKLYFDDDQETPDTQIVTWDFDRLKMVFEMTLWTPYMKKMPWELRDGDTYPDWPYDGMKVEVYGSKGLMYVERHGGGWQVFDADAKKVAEMNDRHPHIAHVQNFFDCLESRARPNAEIEEGHRSTILCQMGNISHLLGGQRLDFDAKTERFVGNDAANKLVKRAYRPPYVVPEEV